MYEDKDHTVLFGLLKGLVGQTIYRSVLQVSSMFALDFGYEMPDQTWRGLWALRVELSVWRIHFPDALLIGSEDDNEIMDLAWTRLLGLKVENIDVEFPTMDTTITFHDQTNIILFSVYSVTDEEDILANWRLHTPQNKTLVMGCGNFYSISDDELN